MESLLLAMGCHDSGQDKAGKTGKETKGILKALKKSCSTWNIAYTLKQAKGLEMKKARC